MISREQAEKYYPRARLPALEQSPADDGHLIGRDPRRMSIAELTGLGHQAGPLLAVIRAKCLDASATSEAKCASAPPSIARFGPIAWRTILSAKSARRSANRGADWRHADRREGHPQNAPQILKRQKQPKGKWPTPRRMTIRPSLGRAPGKMRCARAKLVMPNFGLRAPGRASALRHASNAPDAPGGGKRKTSRDFRADPHKIATPPAGRNFPVRDRARRLRRMLLPPVIEHFCGSPGHLSTCPPSLAHPRRPPASCISTNPHPLDGVQIFEGCAALQKFPRAECARRFGRRMGCLDGCGGRASGRALRADRPIHRAVPSGILKNRPQFPRAAASLATPPHCPDFSPYRSLHTRKAGSRARPRRPRALCVSAGEPALWV